MSTAKAYLLVFLLFGGVFLAFITALFNPFHPLVFHPLVWVGFGMMGLSVILFMTDKGGKQLLSQVSGWTFGLGLMWLTWNIVVSIVGAAIQSNLIANSPFAASPSAWFWSLGLILVGVITGALARKSEK